MAKAPKKPAKPVKSAPAKKAPAKGKAPAKAKPRMTAAQYKAYLHYVDTHFHTAKSKAKAAKKPSKPVMAIGQAVKDGRWILGGNDKADTCGIVAIANQLLYAKNVRVSDSELARYDEGLSIQEAMLKVQERGGLGGMILDGFYSMSKIAFPGLVVVTLVEEEPHAALYLGGGRMASWGGAVAMTGDIEEAWVLAWR